MQINVIILNASHDGYKTIFGGCNHTRRLTFSTGALFVTDSIQGRFNSAKSRFHFHPDLHISLKSGFLSVGGPNLF